MAARQQDIAGKLSKEQHVRKRLHQQLASNLGAVVTIFDQHFTIANASIIAKNFPQAIAKLLEILDQVVLHERYHRDLMQRKQCKIIAIDTNNAKQQVYLMLTKCYYNLALAAITKDAEKRNLYKATEYLQACAAISAEINDVSAERERLLYSTLILLLKKEDATISQATALMEQLIASFIKSGVAPIIAYLRMAKDIKDNCSIFMLNSAVIQQVIKYYKKAVTESFSATPPKFDLIVQAYFGLANFYLEKLFDLDNAIKYYSMIATCGCQEGITPESASILLMQISATERLIKIFTETSEPTAEEQQAGRSIYLYIKQDAVQAEYWQQHLTNLQIKQQLAQNTIAAASLGIGGAVVVVGSEGANAGFLPQFVEHKERAADMSLAVEQMAVTAAVGKPVVQHLP